MGNAIAKKFDIPKEHTATAGHCDLWKIYPGTRKADGEEVSVWTMQKDELAKRKPVPLTDKVLAEQVFQVMRKDMVTLKDCDCIGVLKVVEVLEETKTALAFTTERVVCSLADILNKFENIPEKNAHSAYFQENGTISEMEISRGMLTVAEALQYIHSVQRRVHLGVSPESIVITPDGHWKLCSFGMSLQYQEEEFRTASPYFVKVQQNSHIMRVEPDLRYSPPEIAIGGIPPPDVRFLNSAADVFSLGIVAYELFRFNLFLAPQKRLHMSVIQVQNNSVLHHQAALENLSQLDLTVVPSSAAPVIIGMLHPQAPNRTTIADLVNSPYFVSGPLATLRTVDSLPTKDAGSQSAQLMGLQNQLSEFPPRILQGTVLPILGAICSTNTALWVYALPIHVYIASRMGKVEYCTAAQSYIADGLAVLNPTETMSCFLQHVLFIQETFDETFYQAGITNLIINSLDKPITTLQCFAFQTLCDIRVSGIVDQAIFLDKIVPKACREACKNADAGVKVNALYFLSFAVKRLDKPYMAKNLLPSLKYISENDSSPAVSMAVIGTFQAMSSALGVDLIATSVLPVVLPMLMDRSLSTQQFLMVGNLVKELLKDVCDIRSSELGIPSIDLGNKSSVASADPFSTAKDMIRTAAATASVPKINALPMAGGEFPFGAPAASGLGGGEEEVPTPAGMPPPPPSCPAPSTLPPPAPSKPPPGMLPPKPTASIPAAPTSSSGNWYAPTTTSTPSYTLPTVSTAAPAVSEPAAVLSNSSKAEPTGAANSGFSWFSSSTPAAPVAATYAPPTSTSMMAADQHTTSSGVTTSSSPSPITSPAGAGVTSAFGATDQPDIDMDDFMTSFSKKPTTGAGPPATANANAAPTAPITGGIQLKHPKPTPKAKGTGPPLGMKLPSKSVPTTMPSAAGTSIEEQIKQTQMEIARLSGGGNAPVAGAPLGMNMQQPQQQVNNQFVPQQQAPQGNFMQQSPGYPSGQQGSQMPMNNGNNGSYGYGYGQQQSQQQSYSQPSYSSNSNAGAASGTNYPPQHQQQQPAASGGISGYSSNISGYGGGGYASNQSQGGMGAPIMTGYRPPASAQNNQGNRNVPQQNKGKNDPFDIFN